MPAVLARRQHVHRSLGRGASASPTACPEVHRHRRRHAQRYIGIADRMSIARVSTCRHSFPSLAGVFQRCANGVPARMSARMRLYVCPYICPHAHGDDRVGGMYIGIADGLDVPITPFDPPGAIFPTVHGTRATGARTFFSSRAFFCLSVHMSARSER